MQAATGSGQAGLRAGRLASPGGYVATCVALGAILGWIPSFLHGPIPEKFDVLYIQGDTAIWSYYSVRMLIGLWVGITAWPERWWLRGPLCGFVAVFPLTLVSLAMPGCREPCMAVNLTTCTALGAAVAGLAFLLTGRHHR